MEIVLYIILILIFIFLYILFKSLNKSIFFTVVCTLLILHIIVTPKLCIDAALLGANLFFSKVFPSLFPFLVVTSIMMSYDGVSIYSKLFGKLLCKPLRLPVECTFAIVVSVLCGYPLGAKYACDLYEEGSIDINTCQRLINIASNTSPLFAIGAVGTSMLNSSYLGYILLVCNYISCFIIGFILPVGNKRVTTFKPKSIQIKNTNIGNVIKKSIENSVSTCLSIGGYVVLYSVFTNMIKSNILFDIAISKINSLTHISKELISGTLLGLIEMTNGCNLISSSNTNIYIKIIIISFLLGFSGLSIVSQVHSFTYKHNLSMKTYIVRKLIQGFIAALIAMIIYKIQIFNISSEVFNPNYTRGSNLILLSCMLLLITPYATGKLKTLLNIS